MTVCADSPTLRSGRQSLGLVLNDEEEAFTAEDLYGAGAGDTDAHNLSMMSSVDQSHEESMTEFSQLTGGTHCWVGTLKPRRQPACVQLMLLSHIEAQHTMVHTCLLRSPRSHT